jgi:iron-sulfur cluster repair protein YtfE (RIC family)
MTTTPETTNPLLRELQRVHDMLRRDLSSCSSLAEAASAGAPSAHLRDELERLASRSPLFQLKVNCLRYCQLVHSHHGGEDVALFPAVRRSAPHLSAIVDRLEADHRVVSDLLDEVEAAAHRLDEAHAGKARSRLVEALSGLSAHLLEHLNREEEALAPVLLTWEHWPDA